MRDQVPPFVPHKGEEIFVDDEPPDGKMRDFAFAEELDDDAVPSSSRNPFGHHGRRERPCVRHFLYLKQCFCH